MSYYVAEVGMTKIKPEYIKDMASLLAGRYSDLKTDRFRDLVRIYAMDQTANMWYPDFGIWSHDDVVDSWHGRYETALNGDVFTYGICYNLHGSYALFITDFLEEFLPDISAEIIKREYWSEPC